MTRAKLMMGVALTALFAAVPKADAQIQPPSEVGGPRSTSAYAVNPTTTREEDEARQAAYRQRLIERLIVGPQVADEAIETTLDGIRREAQRPATVAGSAIDAGAALVDPNPSAGASGTAGSGRQPVPASVRAAQSSFDAASAYARAHPSDRQAQVAAQAAGRELQAAQRNAETATSAAGSAIRMGGAEVQSGAQHTNTSLQEAVDQRVDTVGRMEGGIVNGGAAGQSGRQPVPASVRAAQSSFDAASAYARAHPSDRQAQVAAQAAGRELQAAQRNAETATRTTPIRPPSDPLIPADGIIGPRTAEALRAAGITVPADGIVGPQTLAEIRAYRERLTSSTGVTPEQQMARDLRFDNEAMQRLDDRAAARARAEAEANERPRPVPTSPSYPTHVRTADERAAYDRRRADDTFRAATVREAALARAEEEARLAAAAVARREAARLADEQRRLTAAAAARAARDGAWNAMVNERFNSGQVWEDFRNGGTLTALALEPIYRNYNPLNTIPPAQSLSAAPNSLSTVGFDPRTFGIPLIRGTLDFNDPAVQSLNEVLYGPLTNRRLNPFDQTRGQSNAQIADVSYRAGSFDVQRDATGRWARETGGYLAASLLDQGGYLRNTTANGLGGLDALLAQPFNVVLTWGAGAFDLDLHMTGPLGRQTPDRFHIYYAAAGDLTAQPFAALIKDCICRSGSEVILTSALNGGGVYRVSVFNFGDQSATSTNLANASQATIQIVRGGTTQSVGNGTTIVGGRVLLTTTAPNGQPGNTWIAAEINPTNGRITVPRAVVQSEGDRNVR